MIFHRRFFPAVLILLVVLLGLVRSAQSDAILNLDQCYQEQTQWCWAGTTQSVLRFYGYNLTQTAIAAYGTNGANEWNWLYGESTNPTRRGINMIMDHFAGLGSTIYGYALSALNTENMMKENRSIFIRWGWDSGGGHFVLPKAISGSILTLMDPWYGPTVNTYAWVVSGSGHTWTHSLSLNTSAPLESPASISYPADDDDGLFTVSWAAVNGAKSYTLERSSSVAFSNAQSIYTGSARQYDQMIFIPGTYYYRVRANNSTGSSSWRAGVYGCVINKTISIVPIFHLLLKK